MTISIAAFTSFTLRGIAGAVLALTAVSAQAQTDFPNKPIHLVVPFPAGGGTDMLARPLAAEISKTLGVTVVVENKPGGGAMIGGRQVAQANPDGYTLLMTVGSPIVVNPSVFDEMPYDSEKDFTGVAEISTMPIALAVQESSPATDLKSFQENLKKSGEPGSFASTGPGSASHILGEAMSRQLGLDLVHIPYQGSAPAVTAMLGGHVSAVLADMAAIKTQVDGGKLKVLAVTGPERGRYVPDMKTFEEQGAKNLPSTWVGVFAPAGTPEPIIEMLSKTIVAAVNTKEISDRIINSGMEPTGKPAKEMTDRLKGDIANWRAVVDSIGGVSLK